MTRSLKTDLNEIGCGAVDWIQLGHGRVQWQSDVKMEMILWAPYKAWDFLISWATTGFSRTTQTHEISKKIWIVSKLPSILTPLCSSQE